jgi:hypothetical protein
MKRKPQYEVKPVPFMPDGRRWRVVRRIRNREWEISRHSSLEEATSEVGRLNSSLAGSGTNTKPLPAMS